MMGKATLLLLTVALFQLAVTQDDDCYTVSTFVGEEPELAADVCAINSALDQSSPDYDAAKDIYENGQLGRIATLKTIATAEYPTPTYQKFAVYFEDDKWMDTIITNALIRKEPFTTDVKRVQTIKKLLQSSVLVQQVMFHVESAVAKAEAGNAQGALRSWDKGMSVFYGADVDCSPFGNGQARGIEFDRMSDGVSETNSAVHEAFKRGGDALQDGSSSQDFFEAVSEARDDILKQITIIYTQAVFKYATLIDEGLEEDKNVEKSQAEGFAYYHAILPLVAEVNEDAANSILEAFNIANPPDEELAEQVIPTMKEVFDDLDLSEEEVNDFDGSRTAVYVIPADPSCRLENQFGDEDGTSTPEIDG